MRATVIFADPCTGARKAVNGSGADSPRGIDHGQSAEARVPPRWSNHRGRLAALCESARFRKDTPFRAVARWSRFVPLRFTTRDQRRHHFKEPREKGTGSKAKRTTPIHCLWLTVRGSRIPCPVGRSRQAGIARLKIPSRSRRAGSYLRGHTAVASTSKNLPGLR